MNIQITIPVYDLSLQDAANESGASLYLKVPACEGNDLEAAIKALISKIFKTPFQLVDQKQELIPTSRGFAGDLFFAKDDSPQKIAVIKVENFSPDFLSRFHSTVLCTEHLGRLNLTQSHIPKLLTLGRWKDKGLIAMSCMPGKGIDALMKKAGAATNDRELHITELEKAVSQLGRALGELHSKAQSSPLSEFRKKEFTRNIIDPSDPEKKIIQQFLKEEVAGCYMHSDAQPANFLWDGQQLSMIDFSNMAKSWDFSKDDKGQIKIEPKGSSVKDVEQFLNCLEEFGAHFHLHDKEIDRSKNAFLEGYRALYPNSHPLFVHRFFRLFWLHVTCIMKEGTLYSYEPGTMDHEALELSLAKTKKKIQTEFI